jgi:hypothetical protein
MVSGDHGVELALEVSVEDGISREGAGHRVPLGAQGIDGRPDDRLVFVAQ